MFSTESIKHLELGERLVRRNPLLYPGARRILRQVEGGGHAERMQWTLDRLRIVLHAAMRTPYGHTVGGNEDPASWPLLDKETVRKFPAGFTAGSAWLAAEAATSGTTGSPLRLRRPVGAIAFEQACIDRILEGLGVEPRTARIAVLRGDVVTAGESGKSRHGGRTALGGRKLLLAANGLSPETLPQYVDALQTFRPDLLYAYPTSLENLCRLLMLDGRRLTLPRVVTSSEVLRPESWELAREVLGCQLADYYGQAERLAFAYAYRPGEYRFLPGYAHVELLPAETREQEDGTRLYEIVGTSLWNLTMPLVRYRTGDFLRLPAGWQSPELEEIAYGLRPFAGVLGRDQDVLVTPDGVRLNGLGIIGRDVEHVLRFQLVQNSLDEVQIFVLPGREFSAADEARLLRNARARIPANMKIRVSTTAALKRTAQGKTPFVIHSTPVREALRRLCATRPMSH